MAPMSTFWNHTIVRPGIQPVRPGWLTNSTLSTWSDPNDPMWFNGLQSSGVTVDVFRPVPHGSTSPHSSLLTPHHYYYIQNNLLNNPNDTSWHRKWFFLESPSKSKKLKNFKSCQYTAYHRHFPSTLSDLQNSDAHRESGTCHRCGKFILWFSSGLAKIIRSGVVATIQQ